VAWSLVRHRCNLVHGDGRRGRSEWHIEASIDDSCDARRADVAGFVASTLRSGGPTSACCARPRSRLNAFGVDAAAAEAQDCSVAREVLATGPMQQGVPQMCMRYFAAALLALASVAPLSSQSLARVRVGLTSPRPTQSAGLRGTAPTPTRGSLLIASGGDSGDTLAKGMMVGALVGLIVGFLININQLQNGGTHSAILPAVGVGALLGLMIGAG
jgi:hypothetical protein